MKVTHVSTARGEITTECEDFAIIAHHHDACAIRFLGEVTEKDAEGNPTVRTITGEVYDVKEWWVETTKTQRSDN